MTIKMIKINASPLFLVVMMTLMGLQLNAQNVSVSKARFLQGDDMNWAKPDVDDASWSEIDITKQWDKQGFPQNTMAYGWYRIHVHIPKSVFQDSDQLNTLIFNLPMADDVDECYLNGKLIGSTGRMPTNPAGYFGGVDVVRNYVVDVRKDGVRLDAENVVAVRVYNRGGSGGLYHNPLTIEGRRHRGLEPSVGRWSLRRRNLQCRRHGPASRSEDAYFPHNPPPNRGSWRGSHQYRSRPLASTGSLRKCSQMHDSSPWLQVLKGMA